MRSILKKIFFTTGVFFLINIILLLSLRGFHSSSDQHELNQLNSKHINPKFPRLRTTTISTSKLAVASLSKSDTVLPVVVFGCNRPRALQTHIQSLIKIRKSPESHPIIASLDCRHAETIQAAKDFGTQVKTIIELPDLGPIHVPEQFSHMSGYYKIARHYNYSINYVLNTLNYDAVIITEDDLELSPDFLDYFQALYPLLIHDKSLWCISAWNDNGIDKKIVREPTLLHRTDFFPGLGWLLTKTVWNEIKAKWPAGFWDDWMRLPEQRQDRVCIRPEISRTAMSIEGKKGVSQGQHFDRFLKKIIKNTEPVDWSSIDVSYLLKDRYDPAFQSEIDSCPVINLSDLNQLKSDMKCAQIRYSNTKEFVAIANTLEIMNDLKSGVPRTAYRGVVRCQYGSTTIFVTPAQQPWKGYS